MLHLYALTDHPAQLPSLRGIADSVLAAVEVNGIDAVFGEAAAGARDTTETAILAHARVVEELAGVNEAVLPARLGTPYANQDALADAVRQRDAQLRTALEHVRGCTEMSVRVIGKSNDATATPRTGGEYMRGRLEVIRSAERVVEKIQDAVGAIVRDSAPQILAAPQFLLSGAYLVPRGAVDSFRSAVETVERDWPELTFVCTGPWPPYSFALVDGERA